MREQIKQALEQATPGPWEVMNGRDIFTQTESLNRAGIKSTDMDGWHIADVYSDRTTDTSLGEVSLGISERLANAHLIANAPEMLRWSVERIEQLEKALEFYAIDENWELPSFGRGHSPVVSDRGTKARQALEKEE